MTQEEIEARALELFPIRKRLNNKETGEFDANLPRRKAYIQGFLDAYNGYIVEIKTKDLIEIYKRHAKRDGIDYDDPKIAW